MVFEELGLLRIKSDLSGLPSAESRALFQVYLYSFFGGGESTILRRKTTEDGT